MQAYLSKLSNTHKVVWTKILEINNISLKVCWSPRSKISDGEAGARGPGDSGPAASEASDQFAQTVGSSPHPDTDSDQEMEH